MTVASWLVRSTLEWAVQVQVLAGDIALCSWARHFTLTVPKYMYKWVPADCWGNLTNCTKVTCDGLASHPGEVEIFPAAFCYRNRDKLRQLWASLGSKASPSWLCDKSISCRILTKEATSESKQQISNHEQSRIILSTRALWWCIILFSPGKKISL